ncbi:MAG: pyridoxamine 5'-phosphate oxidase [Candidatus Palauibacterales bacterium]|jgi:pyridoxamine 5'-phosphate oxidase|nr:pyridoxamine 5'-phosphate oxidase [Candidatus Palauibacterales bacterium]
MTLRSTLRAFFTTGKGVVRGLTEEAAGSDPLVLFDRWYREARDAGLYLPESMALATATSDGRPSVRQVLLKAFDERGFVFYTNYESQKGMEIAENPRAALAIHWPILQRQVRINGTVEKTSTEESEAYFASRPRGSRLGAWASDQSSVLRDREELEGRFRETQHRFGSGDIPLPSFWGGYRVVPEKIEFWQGRANRLHDRLLFRRADGAWTIERLYP